jgi:CRISPR/Cas system type I-B associated protein Csh2 (Cas7 group RAMP superfamily)
MGCKSNVPCDLYVSHGVVSADEAVGTGFGEDDLASPGDPLKGVFDPDRSTIPANVEVLEQVNPTP